MHKKFPAYRPDAIARSNADRETILGCVTISDLSNSLLGMDIEQALSEQGIKRYLDGPDFNAAADYFRNPAYTDFLKSLIAKLNDVAASFGFPEAPAQRLNGSKIDIALSIALIESMEAEGFVTSPYQMNDRRVQAFMTQRVLPLITFWRWKVISGKTLSVDRVQSSTRNYFYTLWLSGWLFDKGASGDSRWELLHTMTADSLVQIIERSGIGYRKGFAQAIARERKNRSQERGSVELDLLVRGCMKRAVFTFSTSAMPDSEAFYTEICRYLFDWAATNYLPEEEDQESL